MIEIIKETFKSLLSKMTFCIWLIATAGSVLAGPFGTFSSMSFEMRIFYWPLITTTSIFLGYVAYAISRLIFGFEENLKSKLTSGIVGTLLISTDVYLISKAIDPERAAQVDFYSLFVWVGFVFFSVILGRMMFEAAINRQAKEDLALAEAEPETATPETPKQAPQLPRLYARLPPGNHGVVMRLCANDHFVDVTTENGTYAIRMRLRDAVAEMDDVEGTLVHRSHWLAKAAVVQLLKRQGKLFAQLHNGDLVPVSRNYRDDIMQLGFMPDCALAKEQSVEPAQ